MSQPAWEGWLADGIRAVQDQRGTAARDLLLQALREAPQNRQVRYWLGNAYRLCGQAAEAENLFRQLLGSDPGDPDEPRVAFALAFLLREQGDPGAAAEVLDHTAQRAGGNLQLLLQIAGFLRDSNQFRSAIAAVDLAISVAPDRSDLYFQRARLLQSIGSFEPALRDLRHAVDLDPAQGGAWLNLAQLVHFTDEHQPDWQRIRRAGVGTGVELGPEASMCLAFASGKGRDDMGDWPTAWAEYSRGNRLRAAQAPWSAEHWRKFVSAALPPPVRAVRPLNHGERKPIFIVGMLRSGSTLLENLLDRHPRLHARGELNFLAHLAEQSRAEPLATQRTAVAEMLWTQLRLDGPADHGYIDKNPLNFRFLGFLFEALPEARVIHLERDGRDSCLSCFFQLFQHPDAAFANRLEDLVEFYRGYARLMAHWHKLAGGRIYRARYEALVSSPAATVQGVLDFLGEDQHPGMQPAVAGSRPIRTASSWQARQSVHQRSVGRWQNYYAQAPWFFNALAEIDAASSA